MPAFTGRPRLRTALVLGLAGSALLTVTGVASATGVKPYTATLAVAGGAPAWAGTAPTLQVTITNAAREQRLGSVNLTVPAGLAPVALVSPTSSTTLAGNVVRLRNLGLAPRASTTVAFTVRMPCIPANPYVFAVRAKQSNDFNGTGNDFTLSGAAPSLSGTGACGLRFDGQPAGGQRDTDITTQTYQPAAPPVSVRITDASPAAGTVPWETSRVTLGIGAGPPGAGITQGAGGAPAVDAVAGVARFTASTGNAPRIDTSSPQYRLSAAAPGLTGTLSSAAGFAIVDVGVRCTTAPCTGTTTSAATLPAGARVQTTVAAAGWTPGDLLKASLGAPAIDCPNYVETGDTLDFDVTSATGGVSVATKTVTYTILNPTRRARDYRVCFASPTPFRTRDGGMAVIPPGGSLYVGLLPDCGGGRRGEGCRYTADPPCVSGVASVGGTVVITVRAPAGDPRIRA
jgi:hypothetical protein